MLIGNRKSLDLYGNIWINLAHNQRYEAYVSEMDIYHFKRRLRNEGLTFLLRTLPLIGKGLDRFHANSTWSPIAGFKSDDDGVPIFLGNAIRAAIAGDSLAVDCVRQLSYMFYKLETQFDPDSVESLLQSFKKTDAELLTVDLSAQRALINSARSLIWRILCNTDPFDIRPCHGSGSTADRMENHEKWHRLLYYKQLDDSFSYSDHFFFSPTHLIDEYDKLEESEELDPTARICLVPKDSRGPRIISCEPSAFMFIQQGLMRKLYNVIESHPLTRGFVNFTNQAVNREIARSSSKTGEFATIDLSDASDRVSLELVRSLFPPNWVQAFEACRSKSTKLPNGDVVVFNKFAPMGSSWCFPVDALVCWAIASASTHLAQNPSDIYVYGDDIAVSAVNCTVVISALEAVGLKVNSDKSYCFGPFRESCGGDYHNHYDVTPIRLRKEPAVLRNSLSTDVDFLNSLIRKFGYDSVSSIIQLIEELYSEPIPRSAHLDLPCVLRTDLTSSNDVFFRRRYNKYLQRFEYRIPQPYTKTLVIREAAWSELLRKELTRELRDRDPDTHENPLARAEAHMFPGEYAVSRSANIKRRWVWLG
jgi:hypothetical protein